MLVRKNGSRKAILTQQNRIHLESQKIDSKILNKIQRDLDKRLDALEDDMSLIFHSKHLEGWREHKLRTFNGLKKTISENIFSFKPIYPYAVKRYKKTIGKKWKQKQKVKNSGSRKLFVYWIDVLDESPAHGGKIFDPSLALRKIKSRLSQESIQILTKAVEGGIIPFYKENAKLEKEFDIAFRDKDKFDKLKSSVFYSPKKVIVKLKPEIEKERKQEKELEEKFNKQWDKADKFLKKFGARTVRKVEWLKQNRFVF